MRGEAVPRSLLGARPDVTSTLVWRPWAVHELATHLPSSGWWLSGGWAIAHTLGRPVRRHVDIDVSVLPSAIVSTLRTLTEDQPYLAWEARRGHLIPLPTHPEELAESTTRLRSIWIQDPTTEVFVLQINVESGTPDSWVYRRDPRITASWTSAIREVQGIRTGSIATQLLWKSKSPRPFDDIDLAVALRGMGVETLGWLTAAVRLAHPASPWVTRLTRLSEFYGQGDS